MYSLNCAACLENNSSPDLGVSNLEYLMSVARAIRVNLNMSDEYLAPKFQINIHQCQILERGYTSVTTIPLQIESPQ